MTNTYFIKAFNGKNHFGLYLLMLFVVFLATQVGGILFFFVVVMKASISGVEMNINNLIDFTSIGINSNFGLVLLTLPFVAGLYLFFISIKHVHQRSFTDTLTGRKKFEWRRFFFATEVWGGLMILSTIIEYMVNPDNYILQFDLNQFMMLFFISIIFLGLQSTFEEVIFRGYLQQGIAVLTKNTWIPLILTSLLFGFMHYSNPEVNEFGATIMLPQYIFLGFILAICVIMDEGLEIAIGVHVVNNVLSALIYTHKSSVLQTHAIFRVEKIDPVHRFYELIICSVVLLIIMSNKYEWGSFRKIFYRIKPEMIN